MANGLLGNIGSDTLIDFGTGLLAQSGPVVGGPAPSLGQAFASGMQNVRLGELQRLRNDAIRQELVQRKRQQDAMQQLSGLLGSTTAVPTTVGTIPAARREGAQERTVEGMNVDIPTLQTPEGQQQLMGLLADAAPEEFVSGLLAQQLPDERSAPKSIRVAEFLSDPTVSDQIKQDVRDIEGIGAEATDEQLRQLEVSRTLLETQRMLQEMREESESGRISEELQGQAIRGSLRDAETIAESLFTLEDTALATGVPMSQLRRDAAQGVAELKRAFGMETEEAQKLVDAVDKMEKSRASLVANMATGMFGGDLTNDKLALIDKSTPSMSLSIEANKSVLADRVRGLIEEAEIKGSDVDAERYRRLLDRLEGEPRRPQRGPQRPKKQPQTIDLGGGATLEIIE